ncbi:acyl-CoA--6-aminopenicillanic acid acyltransferase [Virgibacillus halodenitrificans]|uniref:Acyl-CoA--6-aminopenicillanic acid acyltransferase n=1 Tax=Virgibacillus halodenitrificans TaxID=1482 RepID=A0AAC9IVZ0_VIRHA|nr:C45 family peptidase [Virgibacillus halodenitrificans]APC47211.1 acyl-CoA--6-aminopenicillanic acid acyltransferase [Virgibacillus halodenitrificans]CDQ36745.1 putative choloylglycine hydrolase [Virgibacillus halodenitrificans]
MKRIYSDIFQFRGSHYEFGYHQGLLLKDSFTLKNRDKQWKIRRPRFSISEAEVKAAIIPLAPGVWDELTGLRDALGWNMNKVLMEFGGYRLDYVKSGCSIFTDTNYMIRNYDYHPKTYEGRYTLYQPTDQGYAVIGPSQRITGRMDGMNEKGLALGYNFMHRKKPGEGFICNMIGRMTLEICADVGEAIHFLKEIPHRHSFSYILLDREGETFVVEATPRGVEVRTSNVCTNHFEILKDENRYHLNDSYKRMTAMEKQKGQVTDAYKAFRMLNDTDKGVFSDQYKNWSGTIHTSAYFPKEMKAWFALGGDREPVVINFQDWLQGKEIGIKRILGEVNTELPFVHMEDQVR